MLPILLIIAILLVGFMLGGLRGAVWVPARTHDTTVLLRSLDIAPDAQIYEFGSGDGRNLRLVHCIYPKAKLAAIEINPIMWLISILRAGTIAKIRLGDGWRADLSGQDVVITFLTPPFMARFEQKMRAELKPGSLIISYYFPLPGLKPIAQKDNYLVYQID